MKRVKLYLVLCIVMLSAVGCARVQSRYSKISEDIKTRTTNREKPVTLYSFKMVNDNIKRPEGTRITSAPMILKVIERGDESWVAKEDNSAYYAGGKKLKCNNAARKCSTEDGGNAGWHFDWDNIGGAILWRYQKESNPWEMYTQLN